MDSANIESSSFYPHKGPSKYAYTSAFYGFREKTGKAAKANTDYSGLATQSGNKFKILFNLKMLVDGARAAEMAFLADTGIDLSAGANAKNIFENFNLILNSEQLFHRNLDMFKQLSQGVNNKLIDPSKYFYSYLSKYIRDYGIASKININKLAGKQLEQFTNEVLGHALEDTYRRFLEVSDVEGNIKTVTNKYNLKNNEQYRETLHEMADTIKKLRETGIFGKYASLFNMDSLLEQASNNTGRVVRKPKLSIKSFDSGGTPLELITSTVAVEMAKIHQTIHSGDFTLTISGEQTGGKNFNQQKGDSIIAYAQGSVDFSEMERIFQNQNKNDSIRVQNIQALDDYLNKVRDKIKHLIVISDKNYTINADWKGAHAQEKMTLANAQPMLERFGVSGVQGLIDYLANCGPEMIQGDVNGQVRTALASYIAYFLFDHLEITGTVSGGTNVVNIINLSGTYIPLSVYLEGVYKSIEANLLNLSTNPDNLVNVTISLGGSSPTTPWTPGAWEDFRTGRETKSTIEYRIMQDIASYITGLMG